MNDSLTATLLKDPLSVVARAERRLLLGVSTLSIFVTRVGLIPTKISALGIDFAPSDQHALLNVMACVVVYFLFAFVIYAFSDYLLWKVVCDESQPIRRKGFFDQEASGTVDRANLSKGGLVDLLPHSPYLMARPTAIIRAIFEFGLPILVAIYAILSLLLKQA